MSESCCSRECLHYDLQGKDVFVACIATFQKCSTVAQELGVSILQDLHRQRQTISHARDTLHSADDNISRARRVLTSMSRRITTNKLIMIGIILLLLVSIFLVVYYKYIKK